jgi:hypothetical protein
MAWMNKLQYEVFSGNEWGTKPVAVTNVGTCNSIQGLYGEKDNCSYTNLTVIEKSAKAQLAATDTIQVVSSSASDTTQTVTLEGANSSGAYISETIALTGNTAVDSTSALWKAVHNVYLSAACAGNITVRRKTGATGIWVIAIGDFTPKSASYVVPLNKKCGYLSDFWATTNEAGTVGVFISSAQVLDATTITWLPVWERVIADTGGNTESKHFYMPIRVPAGYAVSVQATGSATADVKGMLMGWNE